MRSPLATFLVAAPDQPGLVARLAGFFYDAGLNIVDASNHTDPHADGGPRFFMRLVVDLGGLGSPPALAALGGSATRSALQASFGGLCAALSATWSVGYDDHVPRVAILVTKDPACLYDLVLRQRAGEIACEIPLVLSNHPTLEPVAQSFAIPFYCLPVTAETKPAQEQHILELCARHHVELVVLARYMQILSEDFLAAAPPGDQHPPRLPPRLPGRAALPPGARPRGEAGGGDRALRHAGPGPGPDHRAGRGPGGPHHGPRRRWPASAATWSAWCSRARCAPTWSGA